MEAAPNGNVEVANRNETKKKRSWGSAFLTFLASGGIILLLVVGVVITIAISVLLK